MSRFDDFAYFNDNQIADLNMLLEHQGRTVDVYRQSAGTKPGFSSELGTRVRLTRILAYITSNAEPTQVGSSDMRANLQEYIGVTNYTDSIIGDEWRLPSGKKYRVKSVQQELDNIVQVLLELIL